MQANLENLIKQNLRDVPDFPKKGIVFKDVTPLLSNADLFEKTICGLVEMIKPYNPEAIAGIEARGFIFGTPVANRMNLPFIPIRKPGKLPWKTRRTDYTLEYGTASIEVHEDALAGIGNNKPKVVIIDDLLATGGTTAAACDLIKQIGGEIVLCAFVIELTFLNGKKNIPDNINIKSLCSI